MPRNIRAVLFDLDGTLADTAPDLAWALNQVRREQGLEPLPYDRIRPAVSHGSRALIERGFSLAPDDPRFEPLRRRLLDLYRANLARETRLFDGMDEVLAELEARGLRWGVVTNKPAWLTEPLLAALELDHRAAAIVSGDTVDQRKPHPAPLIHACELAGTDAAHCLYVGDARRDIEAGRAAGMHTLVALFGYLDEDDDPATWSADALVTTPADILRWIDTAD